MLMLPCMAWYLLLYSSFGLPYFVGLFTCFLESERGHSTTEPCFSRFLFNSAILEISWRGRVSHFISDRASACITAFKSRPQKASALPDSLRAGSFIGSWHKHARKSAMAAPEINR
jgi:hypothetical protein